MTAFSKIPRLLGVITLACATVLLSACGGSDEPEKFTIAAYLSPRGAVSPLPGVPLSSPTRDEAVARLNAIKISFTRERCGNLIPSNNLGAPLILLVDIDKSNLALALRNGFFLPFEDEIFTFKEEVGASAPFC